MNDFREGRMSREERFDRWIREAAGSYNRPPETPVEAMWNEIDGRSGSEEGDREGSGRGRGSTPFLRGWTARGLAVAAALVMGLALGRFNAGGGDGGSRADTESVGSPEPGAYGLAAGDHFARAEVLLTALRTGDGGPAATITLDAWAGALLAETRLYLDSPAGDDPGLRSLLEDLELVLAQIAVAESEGEGGADRERAREAMEGRDLLLRLRNATPSRGWSHGS